MFRGQLLPFQEAHEINLLEKMRRLEEVVLTAPTGSGKTVIASKFIDDYLDENPRTVFLWLCPGAGGLHKQASESFVSFTEGIPTGDVYDYLNDSAPEGKVFFINWDKINKSSNKVLKEGEFKDLYSAILGNHLNGIDIFVVIDEEHKYKDTASEFLGYSHPKHVLRISATPTSQGDDKEIIQDGEVINEGLIAAGISINEGLEEAIEHKNNLDDDLLLLELADQKRKEILDEYHSMGKQIRPLVLVQFPKGSDEWIKRVKNKLADMGYTDESGLITEWFSEKHPADPAEILKLNGQYAFLLFKQAIATGWDCPRAKILVKLREGGTEAFNIQTIGRIRRSPERCHYNSDLLDNCYVYTLDSQYQSGLTSGINETFYMYEYKKKTDSPVISLVSERLIKEDEYTPDDLKVISVLRRKFLSKYPVNQSGYLDRETLKNIDGFVFGSILKAQAIVGVARTVTEVSTLTRINAGEHEINLHDDGFIIRDARRKIAAAVNTDERIVNKAMLVLFGPLDENDPLKSQQEKIFEKSVKLIPNMTLKEFNAFEVNNRDRLVELFKGISPIDIGDLKESEIEQIEWNPPTRQYYKHHKRKPAEITLNKNIFENYQDNILIDPNRSKGEILFEKWCENSKEVKWVYKNGDKGAEFFSIVYRDRFKRAHFYPDYVIQLNDDSLWIVEVKGGVNADDKTQNIDDRASNKFSALKAYGERFKNINWVFARPIGDDLYVSNTEWTENMLQRTDVWKNINSVIRT